MGSAFVPAAREAVDLFVYRIARELGSLAAALGGLDALIFTAGIGEHAAEIRARVCAGAQWLGIVLDDAAHAAGGPRISLAGSRASAWVRPTDENLMIARHSGVCSMAEARDRSGPPEGLPLWIIIAYALIRSPKREQPVADTSESLPGVANP